MIQSVTSGGMKIVEGAGLSQGKGLGGSNGKLFSSGSTGMVRRAVVMTAMPNGDPPSLMLWGDDEGQDMRLARGGAGVRA